MKSIQWLAMASVVAMQPAIAQAKDEPPTILAPSSNWHLDMGDNKCRIARSFGDEKNRTAFYLEQWEPGKSADWLVAGPPFDRFKPSRKATLTFSTGGDAQEFEFLDASLGDFGRSIGGITTIVPNTEPVPEPGKKRISEDQRNYSLDPRGMPKLGVKSAKQIVMLNVAQESRGSVTLRLGEMDKPLEAMNLCMEGLVKSWGLDVEQQKQVVSPPRIANMGEVGSQVLKDYPAKALQKGAQATFYLRLIVDAEGKTENCALLNLTLADDFDYSRHPCAVFSKYAEIEPARGIKGEAVPSYYMVRIRYVIPG